MVQLQNHPETASGDSGSGFWRSALEHSARVSLTSAILMAIIDHRKWDGPSCTRGTADSGFSKGATNRCGSWSSGNRQMELRINSGFHIVAPTEVAFQYGDGGRCDRSRNGSSLVPGELDWHCVHLSTSAPGVRPDLVSRSHGKPTIPIIFPNLSSRLGTLRGDGLLVSGAVVEAVEVNQFDVGALIGGFDEAGSESSQ